MRKKGTKKILLKKAKWGSKLDWVLWEETLKWRAVLAKVFGGNTPM